MSLEIIGKILIIMAKLMILYSCIKYLFYNKNIIACLFFAGMTFFLLIRVGHTIQFVLAENISDLEAPWWTLLNHIIEMFGVIGMLCFATGFFKLIDLSCEKRKD